jgi:hypothetical protein
MSKLHGFKPSAERQAEDERYEALPVTERCLLCEWSYLGTALEGRERALRHRLELHPEMTGKRRMPRRNLGSFRQVNLTPEEEEEILSERDKRARLLGVELQ